MALSRALSNIYRHIATTTTTIAFRHQIHRNKFSSVEYNRAVENSEYHGLLIEGHQVPLLFYHGENGFVFRLDVPGIRYPDLRCTAHASKFSFTAQEPKSHRFGLGHCEPRYYEAEIEVDPLVYQPERFTAKVNNGVLSVQIPKLRVGTDSPKRGWICLHVGQIKTHVDADGKTTYVLSNPN